MSEKYAEYKYYYELGLWSETKLRNAVTKGKLTSDEFEKITGKTYVTA